MTRRLFQLVAAQGNPTQPLGARGQNLTAEGGRHQLGLARRRFHCRGDFLSRTLDAGDFVGEVQACNAGENAQRRRHRLGYRMLRALGRPRGPGFDGLIQLGDGGLKLAQILRSHGAGEGAVSFSEVQQRPFFRQAYGQGGRLRLHASFGIRDSRPRDQFDAIEIRLRLEGDGQLAVIGRDQQRGAD